VTYLETLAALQGLLDENVSVLVTKRRDSRDRIVAMLTGTLRSGHTMDVSTLAHGAAAAYASGDSVGFVVGDEPLHSGMFWIAENEFQVGALIGDGKTIAYVLDGVCVEVRQVDAPEE
jgi:hypothetical protein